MVICARNSSKCSMILLSILLINLTSKSKWCGNKQLKYLRESMQRKLLNSKIGIGSSPRNYILPIWNWITTVKSCMKFGRLIGLMSIILSASVFWGWKIVEAMGTGTCIHNHLTNQAWRENQKCQIFQISKISIRNNFRKLIYTKTKNLEESRRIMGRKMSIISISRKMDLS